MNKSPMIKKNQSSAEKQEVNVIPKMLMRVFQQEEQNSSQYSSQSHSQSSSAQKQISDKKDPFEELKEVPKSSKLSSKNQVLIEEMQEINSFQVNNGEELIKFDDNMSYQTQDSFTHRLFNLPQNVLRIIISYLLDDFRSLNIVSAKWYVGIHQILNEWLEEVDNKFLKANMQILTIKNSFLSFTPFKIGTKQSFRLDRGIIAEVLPGLEGKTVTLGFIYQNMQGPDQYKYEFKYDVIGKRENRQIWVLRESTRHNYDEDQVTQTAQIVQVCSDDNIRISINFFNLNGMINLNSIVWEAPIIEITPKIETPNSKFKKKNHRGCYLEKQYDDWILYEYFPNQSHKMKLDNMAPQLILQEARCAGIDTVINRMIYLCDQKGIRLNDFISSEGFIWKNELGVPIKVVGQKEEVTVEVKKFGLIADLQLPLLLRKGDILVFYLTKGD